MKMKTKILNPNHIGLIGNGVRRWAKLHNIELLSAYKHASKNIEEFIDFFFLNSAKILSLYLLSKDNLNRNENDLNAAIDGEIYFINTTLTELVQKWNCEIQLAGNPKILPEIYLESIHKITKLNSRTSDKKIYLLVGYCPYDEINICGIKKQKNILDNLWVKEPVDIVIRTSGEYRLSNFLPLQCAYSELFFLKKHINDLSASDCNTILEEYYTRQRRFGK